MKNLLPQFSIALVAFIVLVFLTAYNRPAAEEPKQYMVVYKNITNTEKFAEEVNQKLSEGWRLQGGVAYLNGNCFAQAMVK